MAAPRATQFIALRNLARGSQQVRQLHMTGPATYASPVLTKERSVLNLPNDLAGLRAECKRRKIEISGSKTDLIARLNANELAHSRAFTTKRPTTTSEQNVPTTRQLNTSRELKAVKDTSTIDFAFLPTDLAPEAIDMYSQVRVPILPSMSLHNSSAHNNAIEPEEIVVMKPQISSTSADAIFLPMAEMADDHAMGIDFHAMADRVAVNLRRISDPVEAQASMMKQVVTDIIDDMMMVRKPAAVRN